MIKTAPKMFSGKIVFFIYAKVLVLKNYTFLVKPRSNIIVANIMLTEMKIILLLNFRNYILVLFLNKTISSNLVPKFITKIFVTFVPSISL